MTLLFSRGTSKIPGHKFLKCTKELSVGLFQTFWRKLIFYSDRQIW